MILSQACFVGEKNNYTATAIRTQNQKVGERSLLFSNLKFLAANAIIKGRQWVVSALRVPSPLLQISPQRDGRSRRSLARRKPFD